MNRAKILTDYATRHDDRQDFMHSSGYAKAQSGGNFGAASAASFATRQAINEQRQFVKGYNDSKLMGSAMRSEKPKRYEPMTDAKEADKEASSQNERFKLGEKRAQFSANRHDLGKPAEMPKSRVVLGDAKAPQVPSKRGGI